MLHAYGITQGLPPASVAVYWRVMRKIRMKKYLFIVIVFLGACQEDPSVVTHFPKPSDVEGTWESLSQYQYFPYAALKMNRDGTGKVVLVTTEHTSIEATLSDFKTEKETFLVTLTGSEEGDEPELWEGSLKRGQLCFQMMDRDPSEKREEDEFPFVCFTKATEVEGYRKVANEVLGE